MAAKGQEKLSTTYPNFDHVFPRIIPSHTKNLGFLKELPMPERYFNYQKYIADSYWDRRYFVRRWWSLQREDKRWSPPYFAALHPLLHPQREPHMARLGAEFVRMEGLVRRAATGVAGSAMLDSTLATALLLLDPQRTDPAAYLSHFHNVNDIDSIETFFYYLSEKVGEWGTQKMIGPCILSPHLQCGALIDSFDRPPPIYTPYNAPYLPELLQNSMRPVEERRLYYIEVPPRHALSADASTFSSGPAQLTPLEPTRLARSLLPLFQAACSTSALFPAPDKLEAAFLLRQIMHMPTMAWVARIQHQPVGFILLQPDLGQTLRRANGGRNWLWRSWLTWRSGRPAAEGRVLFAGVLPTWRRRGIGRQLLQQALLTAANRGWRSLTVGPLAEQQPGATLLRSVGATARQRYQIYETNF